ncbi:MAG: hypothetical protein N2511_02630 [Thermodesulfovibrionales bacterium]|nr:hypothetical protein [Thermodesulfovibrionales bacterium]
MDDVTKLKRLLHHWMEHNDEHAETYKEWAEKISKLGKGELSDILLKLHVESKKLKDLFQEALKACEKFQ